MKVFIFLTAVLALVGCTGSEVNFSSTDEPSADGQAKLTEDEAREISPIGEVCVVGETFTVFVPANRGRGNDHGYEMTVDTREFFPAYLWGDVDNDGTAFTELDARQAVKKLYVRQIEDAECPAQADIGIFPQGFGIDHFFTAEDIYQWNQVKHGLNTGPEGNVTICQPTCEILNHMSPDFKKQRN